MPASKTKKKDPPKQTAAKPPPKPTKPVTKPATKPAAKTAAKTNAPKPPDAPPRCSTHRSGEEPAPAPVGKDKRKVKDNTDLIPPVTSNKPAVATDDEDEDEEENTSVNNTFGGGGGLSRPDTPPHASPLKTPPFSFGSPGKLLGGPGDEDEQARDSRSPSLAPNTPSWPPPTPLLRDRSPTPPAPPPKTSAEGNTPSPCHNSNSEGSDNDKSQDSEGDKSQDGDGDNTESGGDGDKSESGSDGDKSESGGNGDKSQDSDGDKFQDSDSDKSEGGHVPHPSPPPPPNSKAPLPSPSPLLSPPPNNESQGGNVPPWPRPSPPPDNESQGRNTPPPPPPNNKLQGLADLSMHQSRNPSMPTQPPGKPHKKGKEKETSSAEENTAKLRCKELRESRKLLEEEVQKFEVEVDKQAAELAKTLHLDVDEVKQRLGHASRWKKKCACNEFNAKVWRRGEELNAGKEPGDPTNLMMQDLQQHIRDEVEGTWSAGELAQLKVDYTIHKEAESKGTRGRNSDASKVTLATEFMKRQLALLQHRSDTHAFCVIVGANVQDTTPAICVGTPRSLAFLPQVLGMDTPSLALKMSKWVCIKDAPPKDPTKKRSEVVSMLEDGLHASPSFLWPKLLTLILSKGRETKNPNAKMEYVNHERVIMARMGVELVGWPEGHKMMAPSKMASGGAACITELVRPAAGKVRRKGKAKRKRAEKEESEEEDEAAETGLEDEAGGKAKDKGKGKGKEVAAPKKKKKVAATEEEGKKEEPPKKRKREKKNGGDGGPTGKAKKRSCDHNDEDEDDDAAPPAKRPKPKKMVLVVEVPVKPAFSKRRAHKSAEFVDLTNEEGGGGSGGSDGEDEPDGSPEPRKTGMGAPASKTPRVTGFFEGKARLLAEKTEREAAKKRMLALVGSGSNAIAGPSKPRPKSLKEIDSDGSYEMDGPDSD
ncbi:hypothetical protein B0H10DRAFT_2244548 [Mycena sp. CBHHK59/15]|nr:hypothetical protein B0H10DRAFT_2244548 [Mycena sp. CBHHK59/15]